MGISLLLLFMVAILTHGTQAICFVSPSTAESTILKKTPLGSSENDVIRYLASRGKSDFDKFPVGFSKRGDGPGENRLIGEKSIKATVGNCFSLGFKRLVVASWAFDENDRLVGVWVRSYVDAF